MAEKSHTGFASSLGLAFFVSTSGLLVVWLVTLSLWQSFEWFAVAYGVCIVLPTGFLVRVAGGRTRDGVIAVAVALVMGGGTYAWSSPEVRATCLNALAPHLPVSTLFSALDDVEQVSVAACHGLLRTNFDRLRFRVSDFSKRPAVTAACLSKDLSGTDGDYLMRREIVQIWSESLMTGTSPEVCAYMDPFVKLNAIQHQDAAARLLLLVSGAQLPEVRECARAAFVAEYPTSLQQLKALGNPKGIELKVAERLLTTLISASYGETVDPKIRELTATPVLKQWGLSLGCSLMSIGPTPAIYAQRLNVATRLQSCAVIEGEMAVTVWSTACEESTENSEDGLVTTHKLCGMIRRSARDVAVEMASVILHNALQTMKQNELSVEIAMGQRSLDADQMSNAFLPSDDLLDDYDPYMAAQMGREFRDHRRQLGGYQKEVLEGRVGKGPSKGMVQAALEIAKTGEIRGNRIPKDGDIDIQKMFTREMIGEMEKMLTDPSLDRSGLITADSDMGFDMGEEGMSVEELLGTELGR